MFSSLVVFLHFYDNFPKNIAIRLDCTNFNSQDSDGAKIEI